ncbi:MAG: ABC transporter permease [Acidimicrobiia bacterium]|nr:ABC transporter permease [Acidimicrobiia bacterium]
MIRTVFTKSLWDRRRSIVWWNVGMAALAAITVAFVPSIRNDAAQFEALFESLPEGLLSVFGVSDTASLVTATGFINSRLYTGIGPVIVAVLGISLGTAAVAGEEDRGTMDLLLAQPVTRTRLVLEKSGAAVVLISLVALMLFITLIIANPVVDLGLGIEHMLAANVGLALFALVFFGFSLAVGAWTGYRAMTVGVSAGLAAAAFFINGLAPLVDGLSWAQRLSPYHWLQEPNPLANGFAWGWFSLMLVVTATLVGIAILGFNRRDIAV